MEIETAEGRAWIAKALQKAQFYLAQNHLGLADLHARDVLDRDPGHPEALGIVGKVAVRLGMREQAVSALTRALAAQESPETAELLRQARALPAIVRKPQAFLVIKAWHAGFWSEVSNVLGVLLLAELTDRIPVTMWGDNCLYGDGSSADAFRDYFEPLSGISPADLMSIADGEFFPAKWTARTLAANEYQKFSGADSRLPAIHFLPRTELVAVVDYFVGVPDLMGWIPEGHHLHGMSMKAVYQYLIQKYLRPAAPVRNALAAMSRDLDLPNIEISLHIRGSDKAAEVSNLDEMNAHYLKILANNYNGGRILLLTEDERLIPPFTERYGAKVVVPDCQRQSGGTAPHFRKDVSRAVLGIEAARDVYAAAQTLRFIGNGRSNFSCMVPLLMPPSSRGFLLGENVLFERNKFRFEMPPS